MRRPSELPSPAASRSFSPTSSLSPPVCFNLVSVHPPGASQHDSQGQPLRPPRPRVQPPQAPRPNFLYQLVAFARGTLAPGGQRWCRFFGGGVRIVKLLPDRHHHRSAVGKYRLPNGVRTPGMADIFITRPVLSNSGTSKASAPLRCGQAPRRTNSPVEGSPLAAPRIAAARIAAASCRRGSCRI